MPQTRARTSKMNETVSDQTQKKASDLIESIFDDNDDSSEDYVPEYMNKQKKRKLAEKPTKPIKKRKNKNAQSDPKNSKNADSPAAMNKEVNVDGKHVEEDTKKERNDDENDDVDDDDDDDEMWDDVEEMDTNADQQEGHSKPINEAEFLLTQIESAKNAQKPTKRDTKKTTSRKKEDDDDVEETEEHEKREENTGDIVIKVDKRGRLHDEDDTKKKKITLSAAATLKWQIILQSRFFLDCLLARAMIAFRKICCQSDVFRGLALSLSLDDFLVGKEQRDEANHEAGAGNSRALLHIQTIAREFCRKLRISSDAKKCANLVRFDTSSIDAIMMRMYKVFHQQHHRENNAGDDDSEAFHPDLVSLCLYHVFRSLNCPARLVFVIGQLPADAKSADWSIFKCFLDVAYPSSLHASSSPSSLSSEQQEDYKSDDDSGSLIWTFVDVSSSNGHPPFCSYQVSEICAHFRANLGKNSYKNPFYCLALSHENGVAPDNHRGWRNYLSSSPSFSQTTKKLFVRDVTARFDSDYTSFVTRKQRINIDDFLVGLNALNEERRHLANCLYSAVDYSSSMPIIQPEKNNYEETTIRSAYATANQRETQLVRQFHLEKCAVPNTRAEIKGHPLYVLNADLLKFEAIHPNDSRPCGFLQLNKKANAAAASNASERDPTHPMAIHLRSRVHLCHTKETWIKRALVIRPCEAPAKMVKARVTMKRKMQQHNDMADALFFEGAGRGGGGGGLYEDPKVAVFGRWQVEQFEPPRVAPDERIPVNEYGNVEIFQPEMVPLGCVHLRKEGIHRIAKRLGVDAPEAMTGWEFKGANQCRPVMNGCIVKLADARALMDAWLENEKVKRAKQLEKRQKVVLAAWRRLTIGLMARERIQAKHNVAPQPT